MELQPKLKAIIRLMSLGVVADYRKLKEIGRGATSTVYKAQHMKTGKIFALKEFSQSMGKEDTQLIINNEVKALQQLNHPFIVRLEDKFNAQKRKYLVFEYCEEGSLHYMLRSRKPFLEQTAQMIIWCICSAMKELCDLKIAHRDLKLDNILVNKDYEVKLADFGLSRDAGLMKSQCGTPLTMAPEVLGRADGGVYNIKCDTWSLGVITYQMLFQEEPFLMNDKERGIEGLLKAIKSKNLIFPDKNPISDKCKNFISRCLTKNPVQRPTTSQMLQDPWLIEGEIIFKESIHVFEKEYLDREPTPAGNDPKQELQNTLIEIFRYAVQQHCVKLFKQLSLNMPRRLYLMVLDNFSADSPLLKILPFIYLNLTEKIRNMKITFAGPTNFELQIGQFRDFTTRAEYIFQCVKRLTDLEKAQQLIYKGNLEQKLHKSIIEAMIKTLEATPNKVQLKRLEVLEKLCQLLTPDLKNTTITFAIEKQKINECDYIDIEQIMRKITRQDVKQVAQRNYSMAKDYKTFFKDTFIMSHKIEKGKNSSEIRAACEDRHQYEMFKLMINANLRACRRKLNC